MASDSSVSSSDPERTESQSSDRPANADADQTRSKRNRKKKRRDDQVPPKDAKAEASSEAPNEASDQAAGDGTEKEKTHWAFDARGRFLLFAAVPSWLVSMMLHACLLMILALVTFPERSPGDQIVAMASPQNNFEEIEEIDDEEIDPVDVQAFESEASIELNTVEPTEDDVTMPEYEDVDAAPQHFELSDIADLKAPDQDMAVLIGALTGTGLQGRGAEARQAMVKKYGGSKGSEASVASALAWLAEHQLRDGGWSFNHQRGSCRGRCPNPGIIADSRNGATAMALLPFLGAGQTHKKGKYKKTVTAGLSFLIRQMKVRSAMGDLTDSGGNMYSHGLSTIALSEAYAMTNDRELLEPAQLALNFTVYAQDPLGGGWRYTPHTAGDTSVTGWQLMACKSGHMAYLKVPPETIRGAAGFLDYVAVENGAKYGYTVPSPSRSMTAVGLLCRMYLGWKKDTPALKAGVEYLSQIGPTGNIYHDYYATQVMRHYGGALWDKWNNVMRDRLVNSQDRKGHAKGSWYFSASDSPHSSRGGRLYCTSMATMILEVYYRHLPIYGRHAADEDFEL